MKQKYNDKKRLFIKNLGTAWADLGFSCMIENISGRMSVMRWCLGYIDRCSRKWDSFGKVWSGKRKNEKMIGCVGKNERIGKTERIGGWTRAGGTG